MEEAVVRPLPQVVQEEEGAVVLLLKEAGVGQGAGEARGLLREQAAEAGPGREYPGPSLD